MGHVSNRLFATVFLFVALLASAFAQRSNNVIAPLQSVTATGALPDLDVRSFLRTGSFSLLARNRAGTNPTLAVKLQSAGMPTTGQAYTTAGTTENELREGATTKVQLAAKFTQSGAKSVKYVDLFLKKAGTITAGQTLTATLNTNSSGVPSATILGTSAAVAIDTAVTTDYSWVRFTFATAVDLADATIYHVVLTGTYTASASNNVVWRSGTLASGGNQSTHNNTSWTAVTTESHEFILKEQAYTDVTNGAFTTVTTSAGFQTLHFNLDGQLSGFVRPYATIGGTDTPDFFAAVLLNAQSR